KTFERVVIQFDSNNNKNVNKSVSLLVIRLVGLVPYSSDKVVPYKYNATMIENGQDVPLPAASSVVSISNVVKVTHSGRVFGHVPPRIVLTFDLVSAPTCQSGESNRLKANDNDEVLCLIVAENS
ncbi:hypothetical protein KIW84_034736, partial [Lathyrus oleraceus]